MPVYVASNAGAVITDSADSIDDLKTIGGQFVDGSVIRVKYHTSAGDGGGGWFRLDKNGSASEENNGTIIETSAGTNWYWRRELFGGRVITPQMFGFVNDFNGTTGTDNATIVQAAADACDVLNDTIDSYPTLLFPSIAAGYYCQETITVKPLIHVLMESPLVHDKNDSSIGLDVGELATQNNRPRLHLKVSRKSGDTSDWTNEGSIGVRLWNLRAAKDVEIEVGELSGGFTISVQQRGDDLGCSWNVIKLGQLRNSKVALDLVNVNSGFTNENVYIGGEFVCDSGLYAGTSRNCVRLRSDDGTNPRINNNLWIKPSFECRSDCEPIEIQNGQENQWDGLRDEGNSGVLARIRHTGLSGNNLNFGNIFNIGFVDSTGGQIVQEGDAYGNVKTVRSAAYTAKRLVWDSGDVGANAIAHNSSATFIRNMQIGASSTNLGLVAATLPFAHAETFTTNFAVDNDKLLDTAHPLSNGDRVYLTNSGGALPTGLSASPQLYYVVESETNAFKLSTTLGGSAVTFSDDGTGTHTYNARMGHVEISTARNVGRRIDTTNAKNFVLERLTRSGFEGRLMVHCYDADGELMDRDSDFTVDTASDEVVPSSTVAPVAVDDIVTFSTTGTLPAPLAISTDYYVVAVASGEFQVSLTKGGSAINITDAGTGTHTYSQSYGYAAGNGLGWNSTFFGHYRQGTDFSDDLAFRVRDEVKSINVALSGGSAICKLQRFKVFTTDIEAAPTTWLDYEAEPDVFYATQAPTFGVYEGVIEITNYSPSAGSASGWALTEDGAPGTWQSRGELPLHASGSWDPPSLADGAGASNAFTVTGAAIGDFVQVGPPYDLQEILMSASVTASDTVEVRLQNETGGVIDLASGSWKFRITKPPS